MWYSSNEGGLNSFEKWSQATFSFVQLPILNNTAYVKLDCIIRAVAYIAYVETDCLVAAIEAFA